MNSVIANEEFPKSHWGLFTVNNSIITLQFHAFLWWCICEHMSFQQQFKVAVHCSPVIFLYTKWDIDDKYLRFLFRISSRKLSFKIHLSFVKKLLYRKKIFCLLEFTNVDSMIDENVSCRMTFVSKKKNSIYFSTLGIRQTNILKLNGKFLPFFYICTYIFDES